MSGYCNKCGNHPCVCDQVKADEAGQRSELSVRTGSGLTDTQRLDWLLENIADRFDCEINVAGNLERFFVDANREALDMAIGPNTKVSEPGT